MKMMMKKRGFDIENREDLLTLCRIFRDAVKKFFGVKLTLEQKLIALALLYRIFRRKRHTIVISECRQTGKTEVVCYLVWFLSYFFPNLTGDKFRCIITAPERTTGSEVFDRTKMFFDQAQLNNPDKFHFRKKSLDVIQLADGSRVDTYGLFKGFARREEKKTTKEGRTCNLLVRDEMHLGDDQIFKDELEQALSTTGGVDVWIGNGGFRNCRAKELCESINNPDITLFIRDYTYMRKAMLREHEKTGNPMFLRWVESQDKYIEDYGLESDDVQKNLFCKWIVEMGNFIEWERLIGHRRPADYAMTSVIADIGIDLAKEQDETVVTVTDYERNIRDWQIFRGEYTDQVEEIALWLTQCALRHRLTFRYGFCDATGVGDPVKTMLKRRLRFPIRGIVFNVQNKDALAKKMLKSFSGKHERDRMTYPADHELTPKFEKQFRQLLRERRPSGALNFKHPDEHNAHDDFPDSYALSLWNIEKIRGMDGGAKAPENPYSL